MLDGLTGVLRTADKDGVGASRALQGKLVKGEAGTSGLLNAGAGSLGEVEGSHLNLGDFQQTDVIGDAGDSYNDLGVSGLATIARNAGQADWGAIDAGGVETLEDNLVEAGVCAAGQEAVELRMFQVVNSPLK